MASISLIQTAYSHIRERIMAGDYMPGSLLSENHLADELNMSRTPIRSAISQLESEGFLVSLRNRGVLVKELSMKEVMDLLEVIHSFQLLTLDYLKEHRETPDLKKMKAHLDMQLAATDSGNYASYVEHAMQFLRCMLEVTNNKVMLAMVDTFIDKMSMYSTIIYKTTPHEPHYSANKVNQSIYDAFNEFDYAAVLNILNEAYAYNRQRALRTGAI
jgi:DNA-binding GntR family transcriptional regulator